MGFRKMHNKTWRLFRLICCLGIIMSAACAQTSLSSLRPIGVAPEVERNAVWTVVPLLGALQPFGITVNGKGSVFFTELPSGKAKVLLPNGDIESIVAHLKRAEGIAVFRKITYIADTGNLVVKRISSNGKVTTIGSGWDFPQSVATDSAGNLYVYDNGPRKIVRFHNNRQTNSISIPSTCQGVTRGLGLDAHGNMYVSCYAENEVLKIQPDGTATEICTGWQSPFGITSDPAGDVYVANNKSQAIFECTTSGQLQTIMTNKKIGEVTGLAFHDSDLYVTSTDKRQIYKLTPP
jgi:DNA-binding beta-propeller fold protein YncE